MSWSLWVPLMLALAMIGVAFVRFHRRELRILEAQLHNLAVSLETRGDGAAALKALDAFTDRFMGELGGQALILANQRGRIISVSGAFQELFGYEPREVWGQPLTMLMPARYHAPHLAQFGRSMGTERRSVTVHGLHKNGAEFDISILLGSFEVGIDSFFYGLVARLPEPTRAA